MDPEKTHFQVNAAKLRDDLGVIGHLQYIIGDGPSVMITGQQQECTQERFNEFYKPAIEHAFKKGATFLVGAADGVDAMAHTYLSELGAKNVLVFDKGEKDGRGATKKGWLLVNGFSSYPNRDGAMCFLAKFIIVYLFENAATSGTFSNVVNFVLGKKKYSFAHSPGMLGDVIVAVARTFDRSSPYAASGWQYVHDSMFSSIIAPATMPTDDNSV